MLGVSYIRGYLLEDVRSKQLIEKQKEESKNIVERINKANGGMFTRNIITRNFYFNEKIKENIYKFDQLLVLGIGLDTKADALEELKDKKVFGLDINANSIHGIYEEAGLKTNAVILPVDLRNVSKEDILKKLIEQGFSLEERTYMIWEGGTFYIKESEVLDILSFWYDSVNIRGMSIDFLNYDVFHDKTHKSREVIEMVLKILENAKEPWIGYFRPENITTYFRSLGCKHIDLDMHGDIERKIYDEPLVIEDLLFFVTVFD
ncbi:O-methyltransferase [Paenibacillus popilliae ATCC 14706]|uniref:O-methyltransferase n=2 Tax=Paenibacillus popilliae TaxID=78057 RepID=M9M3H8_PAEPP|nr:O-methyltransferase [Paenibacillus popilliae ATCC 14706]